MNAALNILQIHLATLENNEPIHRREGSIEQADSQLEQIQEIKDAIAKLEAKSTITREGRSIHIDCTGNGQ